MKTLPGALGVLSLAVGLLWSERLVRLGQQRAVFRMCVKRTPDWAKLSMCGVWISLP